MNASKPYNAKCLIAGVDEVGRGALAGPVVAAAVIFDPEYPIENLSDSKQISKKQRELLATIIYEKSLAWALGQATHHEIDNMNILQASLVAMKRAVSALSVKPDLVLVDGIHCPDLPYDMRAIIKGDSKIAEISAASIIAKVARDNDMVKLDRQYPGYYFAQHKGYATKLHINALQWLGASCIHRRSFAPIKNAFNNNESEYKS